MAKFLWSLCLVSTLCLLGSALTPSSFLSAVDRQRLSKVFADSLASENANSLAYAVLGFKALGEAVPNPEAACKKLQEMSSSAEAASGGVNTAYQLAAASKALQPACKVTLNEKLTQAVKTALSSDGSVGNLYYATLAQLSLGQAVDKAGLAKVLAAALKKDDSVTNLGYAFNLAADVLDAKDGAAAVYDRIEDAIVQADEVDGKMLQFEGGLTVTHLVVTGAYKLSEKLNKAQAPVTKMQAVKFANYFLSRKTVQQAKPAYHLMVALTKLAANKYHVPVTVTGAQATISEATPNVQVRISDILGNALGKMDVTVESAMRTSDGATVLAKTKMAAAAAGGSDGGLYEVNMFKAEPGRGFYEVTLNAVPAKADERLVGNVGALVGVKVVSTVTLDAVELSIGDADGSVAAKTQKVAYPNKAGSALKADNHNKIGLKFAVKDKTEKIAVHQAFVSLINGASGAEIVFVAEQASGAEGDYSFELDLSAKAKEFADSGSGKYQMRLIVGDAAIANPVSWHLADLDLSFGGEGAEAAAAAGAGDGAKPEIRHKFREPEKRPPTAVSNAFTLLCLVPFAVMFGAWAKLGVNVSGFPVSLSGLGFHLGLGSIFALYYFFWLNMSMFTTLKYLIMIGVVTFLCGNSMLSKIAEKRKAQ